MTPVTGGFRSAGRGRVARACSVIALASILAGCLDAPAPSVLPTPTATPEPTPVTTTYELGTTVWYAGLLIHVDRAVATLDERGGPVAFQLRFENNGEDDADLGARILLQVDADSAHPPVEPTRESTVPTIPAHGVAGAVMTYELQGVASVDRSVLLIGEAPVHVARVPLTESGGGAAAFEPVALDVAGAGAVGDLRIRLHGGLVRWDLPDWAQELPSSLEVMTLTYDVTYTGSFTGGFPFTGDNVRLRLPDGSFVSPRRDGHSQSIELIGAGKTKKNLFSRFEVPSGTTGRFALMVVNGANKAIPFIVGE